MRLTTLKAKFAGMKHKTLKGMAVAAVAGAALMATAPAAQAQRFFVGVRVGAPVYVAPPPPVVYVGPAYYGPHYRDWHRDVRHRR